MINIPEFDWADFLSDFSWFHHGVDVRVVVIGAALEDAPTAIIHDRLRRIQQGEDHITIFTGEHVERAHEVIGPVQLLLAQNQDGEDAMLRIESLQMTLILQLRAQQRPLLSAAQDASETLALAV